MYEIVWLHSRLFKTSAEDESTHPSAGLIPSMLEVQLKAAQFSITDKQQRLLTDLKHLRTLLYQVISFRKIFLQPLAGTASCCYIFSQEKLFFLCYPIVSCKSHRTYMRSTIVSRFERGKEDSWRCIYLNHYCEWYWLRLEDVCGQSLFQRSRWFVCWLFFWLSWRRMSEKVKLFTSCEIIGWNLNAW